MRHMSVKESVSVVVCYMSDLQSGSDPCWAVRTSVSAARERRRTGPGLLSRRANRS